MLGLGGYGSGSDNDSDSETAQTSVLHPSAKSQSLSKSSRQPSSTSSSLPPPKSKKKVAITLPSLKSLSKDDEDDAPPAKKPRLDSGAGVSSLLSMLPAPKQKTVPKAAPARVLGGGAGNHSYIAGPSVPADSDMVDDEPVSIDSLPFIPASLKKGRSNISLEDERPRKAPKRAPSPTPAVDFFSLGSTSTSSAKLTETPSSVVKISSAPSIPTFEIPEPTPTDEYPGYYQLASGQWAQHDPTYYNKFAQKWQREYNAHVRALEKGAAKGFEGLETSDVADVNAAKEMERAKVEIKEREERKALSMGTDGEPAKPKMTVTASKTSGIARSRHQLATMLKEAYENREALEDRIAQGKRNRKEAGNKYGF